MKKTKNVIVAIYLLTIIGEVKCCIKACKCNWEPIGKAEVIYTVGAVTGVGVIIGWFDIQDK